MRRPWTRVHAAVTLATMGDHMRDEGTPDTAPPRQVRIPGFMDVVLKQDAAVDPANWVDSEDGDELPMDLVSTDVEDVERSEKN